MLAPARRTGRMLPVSKSQPGYDAMASAYDAAFPDGYAAPSERHAAALFATELLAANLTGPVLDVGCGAGHVAFDLASRGLKVIGIDPSRQSPAGWWALRGSLGALLAAVDGGVVTSIHRVVEQRHGLL